MKTLKLIIAALFVFGPLAANADVIFDVDGNGSSVNGLGLACEACDISLDLVPDLDDVVFGLSLGGSHTFDFFDITASGNLLGVIVGVVNATLGFELPDAASGTGYAAGFGGFLPFGFFQTAGAGGLTFGSIGQPGLVDFGSGTIAELAFSSVSDTCSGGPFQGCTLEGTVTATVTLVSVPEPGTLALLGLGLAGLGMSRRRKIA